MSEPDDNGHQLIERIREEGEHVGRLHWDSGIPGPGVGFLSIYKFKNEYWCDDDGELDGPYETLAEAMEWTNFGVNDTTIFIWCTELTADQLAARAEFYEAEPGHAVQINLEEWAVSPDGKLERAGDRKSA